MKKLQDKIAVVTGGNSGIGLATASELIAQGATVIITGRNKEAVDKAAREIGATGLVADQSDIQSAEELAKQVETRHGKIDILIVNAAIGMFAPIGLVSEEHYNAVMDTNFKGAFFTLQAFLHILNKGGAVTFVSSSIADTGSPNSSIYNASKAALNSLTRTAAYELAPEGIRVNVVLPGVIETPIFKKVGFSDEDITNLKNGLAQKIPLKRMGTSAEIANLLAFLSSDDASYITGSEYIIDGGLDLKPLTV